MSSRVSAEERRHIYHGGANGRGIRQHIHPAFYTIKLSVVWANCKRSGAYCYSFLNHSLHVSTE